MTAAGRVVRVGIVAAAVSLACAAGGNAAQLTLDVMFSTTNTISVTLPDGTPVGTASGTPTQIPAGYYTVLVTGPMGLPAGLPYFHLTGPKVDVLSNLNESGIESQTYGVTFQPSSTYTWTDDAIPGVVNTFTTSSQVLGTAPATPVSPKSGPPEASQNLVGSDVPHTGKLTAAVAASGRLSLTMTGKHVSSIPPGSYAITVTDRSSKRGFALAKAGRAAKTLTSVAFTGERTVTLSLSAGRWDVLSASGGKPVAEFTVT
jgi:hypothetical protein